MVLRERYAGYFLSSAFVLGQIDYGDDIVRFEKI